MTQSTKPIQYVTRRGALVLLLGSIACTGLSGCMLLAGAAAGGAAGYVAGHESGKDTEHTTVIHEHDDSPTVTEERTVRYRD